MSDKLLMMFRFYAFGFILILQSVFLIQNVKAQSPFFSTLTSRDGLPSNIISAVAQDRHNFIWIGTANGLCRYDGYRFKTFKREESEKTVPDNEISALLVDGDYLWVGTWRGLCKINTITLDITRVDLKGKNVIRTLYKDRNGTVWIGTTDGLIEYKPNNNAFTTYTAEANELSHNTVRTIHEDKLGNLWVGTYDKLNKLIPQTKTFQSYNLKGDYKPNLKNHLICDIKAVKNSDSLIWVGTETGLYRLNVYTSQYTHYGSHNLPLSNEVVKNIYTDPEDNVWLGTDFGLNIFNPETNSINTFFHNPQLSYSIGNNAIWQIMEDEGDVIWLVTSNGLSRTNKHKNFYVYHEISHRIEDQTIGNQIRSMLVTRDNIIWIATLHGVIRLNPETNRQEHFDIDSPPQRRILLNNVTTISEDDLGRIWIGTAGGINVWDEKSEKMYSITANATNGLASNYISKFTKGQDGSFWVSAWEGGLFKIVHGFDDIENIRFEYVGDFSSAKNTYALNAMWAIHNNELVRIDPSSYVTVKMNTFNKIAKGKDVRSLYYAPQKSMWAGTQNGIIEYQVQKDSAVFHPIITGNDTDINNLISDQSGNIWAAANNMILKFRTTDYQIEIFPLEKDLPLKTFSPDCVTKTNSGEIIFAGDNGFISLNTNISPNAYKPNVYLTTIEINNKPVFADQRVDNRTLLTKDISFTDKIILDYAQRSIAFEFAALHYWQPDMNVYAYKLNGFDKEWNYVSGLKNFAVYSNLSPGDYTLIVKGTNNYGVWNDAVAKLQITVKPPLFLSPPFIIAYGIIVILIIIIAMRIYLSRVHLNNELKLARMEKSHAEEIIQTKQQFFTSISHELRTPISLIIPPIQQIIKQGNLDDETHSLISIAEKNAQRLLRLINQILDFRKLEHENQSLTITWFDAVNFSKELYSLFTDKAARKDIDFVFETNLDSCTLWADKEKLEIIIFNLLSNAFKFTPKKGRIEFAISKTTQNARYKHGAVEISVRDNGPGIAQEEHARIFDQFYQTPDARKIEDGSGIGLTLVAEYTKLHRGDIRVESQKGKGTSFIVSLPLGDAHFPVDKNQLQKEIDLVATKTLATKEAAKDTYQFDLRATKPLILLVEDNWDMIQFIQLSLKEKFTFIIADNGEEGLSKAHSFVPDLIISDIMMPVMDGVTMCKKIKHDTRISHIPIIMLTAKSLTSQKVEGIRSGADIYMTKPFEIELLEAHIEQLLEKQHELAEYFKNELITQPVNPSGKENEDDKFLRKAMNTIEANISNSDFSVEVLSEEMGMSTTHLYRKLKSLTQLSANEIIKRYRIKKASLLLKNKEGNISEIMYEVGFSNLSYFSKCFKAEFGLTPKEYQQKMSKGSYEIEI